MSVDISPEQIEEECAYIEHVDLKDPKCRSILMLRTLRAQVDVLEKEVEELRLERSRGGPGWIID